MGVHHFGKILIRIFTHICCTWMVERHWECLDLNHYSHMSHLNGCSPLWECLDLNLWPSKSRSSSWSIIFKLMPFDGKCQIYKRHFYIFHFRLGVTYANDFNIHTDRYTETAKSMAIGGILQICLKTNEFHIFYLNIWNKKLGQCHRVQFLHFDGKCQNLQTSFF